MRIRYVMHVSLDQVLAIRHWRYVAIQILAKRFTISTTHRFWYQFDYINWFQNVQQAVWVV